VCACVFVGACMCACDHVCARVFVEYVAMHLHAELDGTASGVVDAQALKHPFAHTCCLCRGLCVCWGGRIILYVCVCDYTQKARTHIYGGGLRVCVRVQVCVSVCLL
jgi:hypothetical protein